MDEFRNTRVCLIRRSPLKADESCMGEMWRLFFMLVKTRNYRRQVKFGIRDNAVDCFDVEWSNEVPSKAGTGCLETT